MRHALAALLLLAACASAPPIAPDAEPVLTQAEELVASGQAAAARDLLQPRPAETFPKRIRDRYALTLGRALRATGANWDAFIAIRNFADQYPHSDRRLQVVELEFAIGRDLLRSGAGFWIFWSDREAGRECLEHLITRYPESPWMADALRLLGDVAFQDGEYQLAQERYRDLLRRSPESEWASYARFRYAMSIVATLRGPEYDLDEMQHATKELNEFLADPPENPEFVAAAQSARERLLGWQAERHWLVAGFYDRVGNRTGYLQQLHMAAADQFAATDYGKRARQTLAEVEAAGSRP